MSTVPNIPPQFLDDNGDPAASFQLFTYQAGTSTKVATYTDSALSVPNANPIILDAAGRATIFLSAALGSVKFVLAPAADTDPPASPTWTRDNINPVPVNTISSTITRGSATTDAWVTTGVTQALTVPYHPVLISCQSQQTAPVTVDIPAGTLGANGDVITVEWEVGYSSGTHAARMTAFGVNYDLGTGGASVATRAKYVIQRIISTGVNVFQTVFQATAVTTGVTTTAALDLDNNAYSIIATMDGGSATSIGARIVYYRSLDDWTD